MVLLVVDTQKGCFNEFMWGGHYAKIITVEQAVELLKGARG